MGIYSDLVFRIQHFVEYSVAKGDTREQLLRARELDDEALFQLVMFSWQSKSLFRKHELNQSLLDARFLQVGISDPARQLSHVLVADLRRMLAPLGIDTRGRLKPEVVRLGLENWSAISSAPDRSLIDSYGSISRDGWWLLARGNPVEAVTSAERPFIQCAGGSGWSNQQAGEGLEANANQRESPKYPFPADLASLLAHCGGGWSRGGVDADEGVPHTEAEIQEWTNFIGCSGRRDLDDSETSWEDQVLSKMWNPGNACDRDFVKKYWTKGLLDRSAPDVGGALCSHAEIRRAIMNWGASARVARVPVGECCDVCKRLFLDGKGLSRIFEVNDLLANGNNYGRPLAKWRPTAWPVHRGCTCRTVSVPPEAHIDENGLIRFTKVATSRTETAEIPGIVSAILTELSTRDRAKNLLRHVSSLVRPQIASPDVPWSEAGRILEQIDWVEIRLTIELAHVADVVQVATLWHAFLLQTRDELAHRRSAFPLQSAIRELVSRFLRRYDPRLHGVADALENGAASCQARTHMIVGLLAAIPELIPRGWLLGIQTFDCHVQAVLVPEDEANHEVWDLFTNTVEQSRVAPVYLPICALTMLLMDFGTGEDWGRVPSAVELLLRAQDHDSNVNLVAAQTGPGGFDGPRSQSWPKSSARHNGSATSHISSLPTVAPPYRAAANGEFATSNAAIKAEPSDPLAPPAESADGTLVATNQPPRPRRPARVTAERGGAVLPTSSSTDRLPVQVLPGIEGNRDPGAPGPRADFLRGVWKKLLEMLGIRDQRD